MRTLFSLLVLSVAVLGQSNPPHPTPSTKRDQPKQPTANVQNESHPNERGTEQSPVFANIFATTQTKQKATDDKTNDFDKSPADWWMVRLTGAIVLLGCVQTIVFWVQARRLKQTIEKMDKIARDQTKDTQNSIAQATRAAGAMEEVATSMAANVKSINETVDINREIADRQKLISELQSRAYLTIVFEGMVPQNVATGIRFEPRVRVANRGNTPARNVRFGAAADVLPFPLPTDFTFPLPTELAGHSSVIAPGLHKVISAAVPKLYTEAEAAQISSGAGQRIALWGIVKYLDAFGTERFAEFGFTHFFLGDNQWMSQDTTEHNDSN